MASTRRQQVEPDIVALICALGAVLIRLPLEPFLAGTQVWLTFWPAAFLAAWFGGIRAGVSSTTTRMARRCWRC